MRIVLVPWPDAEGRSSAPTRPSTPQRDTALARRRLLPCAAPWLRRHSVTTFARPCVPPSATRRTWCTSSELRAVPVVRPSAAAAVALPDPHDGAAEDARKRQGDS